MSESPMGAKISNPGPSSRGWHRLQLAAECLQKFSFNYRNPHKVDEPMSAKPALAKGSLLHLALAQHYEQSRSAPGEWCDPEEALELVARAQGISRWVPEIKETYRKYVARYRHEDADYRIIGVEELCDTNFGPFYYTGRLDLVVEDAGGRIWVMDHKTSSRVTSKHAEYYSISGQLIGYSILARRKYGDKFAGMIVNLVEIGGGRFERVLLERSENLETDFEQIVKDIERSIERMDQDNRPYDKWPKAINELTCITRYGSCDFIHKCRFGANAKSTAGSWTLDF